MDGRGDKPGITRIAALAAVIAAVVLVGYVLFGSGSTAYTVKARFVNAGQLVKGNLVEIGGTQAGLVKDFEITPDGMAEVELEIDEQYAPLREGTRAIIRQGSLSSVANRYVALHLPGENEAGDPIPDGGLIPADKTTTGVELDQFFNTLDSKTRKAIQRFYRNNNRAYTGRGEQANAGWRYLSSSLNASSDLFEELSHDEPVLEKFLVDSSRFVTALANRREDLAPLIQNLNQTTRALGDESDALRELLERFPGFLRQANTTYVNLRSTLDELDPFVEASKPVARKLLPYLEELRPFTRDARPVVRNLNNLVRLRGGSNDLTELNRTYPGLAQIALDTRTRNGKERRGAFPEMTEAFTNSAPIVAHGRPYTPDFFGWFDDFSQTGAYDALGSFSRAQTIFNAFSLSNNVPTPIPLSEQPEQFKRLAKIGQYRRCPGGAESRAKDGSNVWSEAEQKELDCVEAHRATGPKQ